MSHSAASRTLFDYGPREWPITACLSTDYKTGAYLMGYEQAGELLMQALRQRHATADAIVYPICFIYRNLIEIWLKRIIYRYARSVCDHETLAILRKPNHSLVSLRDRLRATLASTGDDSSWLDEFSLFLDELEAADPRGTSFRYHSGLDGQIELSDSSGAPYRYLALDQLAKKAMELIALLDGADEVIRGRTELDVEDLAYISGWSGE